MNLHDGELLASIKNPPFERANDGCGQKKSAIGPRCRQALYEAIFEWYNEESNRDLEAEI